MADKKRYNYGPAADDDLVPCSMSSIKEVNTAKKNLQAAVLSKKPIDQWISRVRLAARALFIAWGDFLQRNNIDLE